MTDPAHGEHDIALRNGASIHLRPVRPEDEKALLTFLETLSTQSRAFRFFTASANLVAAARSAVAVSADGCGIVAVAGDGRTILAHGMYARWEVGSTSAEVAFAVADVLHGEGIATIMLAHLAATARSAGVTRFVADVLPENPRMAGVFRDSGFEVTIRARAGALFVSMPTELVAGAQKRYDEREAIAAAAAVCRVLRPRSVAVVGASARAGSMGGAMLRNVVAAGFTGDVHAVSTPRWDSRGTGGSALDP